MHIEAVTLTMSAKAKKANASEHCCTQCGAYFLAHWRYIRKSRKEGSKPVESLKLIRKPNRGEMFLVPTAGMHGAFACKVEDLCLISGMLHHARGSFHAAVETFADVQGSPNGAPEHEHKHCETLWFALALIRFLPLEDVRALDWCGFCCPTSQDDWHVSFFTFDSVLHFASLVPGCSSFGKWCVLHLFTNGLLFTFATAKRVANILQLAWMASVE